MCVGSNVGDVFLKVANWPSRVAAPHVKTVRAKLWGGVRVRQ